MRTFYRKLSYVTFLVHSIGLTSIDLITTFCFYLLRQTSLLTRIVVCKGISEKSIAIFWQNRTEKDHGGKRARYLSRQRDLTVPFSSCLVLPTCIIFVRNTLVTIQYEYTIYYHYDILMQDLPRRHRR